jgi:hypothetical protein
MILEARPRRLGCQRCQVMPLPAIMSCAGLIRFCRVMWWPVCPQIVKAQKSRQPEVRGRRSVYHCSVHRSSLEGEDGAAYDERSIPN